MIAMSIKNRLEKLEETRGKKGAPEYVIDSWDDYHRVHHKLGMSRPFNVFIEMNKPEEERQTDLYGQLLSDGRLVETPEFQQLQRESRKVFLQMRFI